MEPNRTKTESSRVELRRLIGVVEFAKLLGVSTRTVRRLVQLEKLPPADLRVGRSLRWRHATVQGVIDEG